MKRQFVTRSNENTYELLKKGLYPMSCGVNVQYTVLDPIEPGTLTVEELVMKQKI